MSAKQDPLFTLLASYTVKVHTIIVQWLPVVLIKATAMSQFTMFFCRTLAIIIYTYVATCIY